MSEDVPRIVVKYCGGCNPRYDRVGLVGRLEEEFSGTARFVPAGEGGGGGDLLLVVCGCHVRCAETTGLSHLPAVFVDRPEDVSEIIRRIRAMLEDRPTEQPSKQRGKIYGSH
jgi:hypothetical protein